MWWRAFPGVASRGHPGMESWRPHRPRASRTATGATRYPARAHQRCADPSQQAAATFSPQFVRVHLEMGGCCGKVALASSLIGDSAEESAVVLKVKNVLGARDENMQLSEQAMLPTIENVNTPASRNWNVREARILIRANPPNELT